jgi:FkbM family methyltransferase
MRTVTIVSHGLCPALLGPRSVIVDLGANKGEFANAMAQQFGCRVYSVEASPETFNRIQDGPLIRKFNAAICGSSGPVKLNVSSNSEATSLKRLNSFDYVDVVTVPGLTLNEFLKNNGIAKIDLLKVDIEGAEIEMFNSCPDDFLRSIDQITVEFHEWAGISTITEVKTILRRLRSLGFSSFNFSRTNFGDVLFVNSRHMSRLNSFATFLGIWVPRIPGFALRLLGKKPRNG